MNRTQKFFRNSMSTALYQVILMIAGFIIPHVMLQFYGSEINGLVTSINQFIVYFNLVEAGLSGAAIYALYKPLADNDHKAINSVVSATKKFYIQAGYVFVSLTIGLAVIYPMLVNTELLTPLNVGFLVLILGVNGSLEFFTLSKYRVLLSADQKTYVVSLASIINIALNTIIVVVLANLNANIIVLRFVALFSIFLRSFILMVYVKRKYKYINYKEKPNMVALNKRWDVLYQQILGAIQLGSPVIVLTIFVGNLSLISIYAIYNMVIAGLNGVLSIFISGLAASFGDVIIRGELKTLQQAYREFEFAYYSLITIIYSIASVTIMSFIRIYTAGITDINYDIPLIGILFVINGFLYNLKTPQGMLVISGGMYRETKWQTTIQGAIAVIGGIILAPYYGIAGVLLSSILSNIYRDIDLLFFVPINLTKLPIKKTASRWLISFCCIIIIQVPFFFIMINASNYFTWAIYAVCVGMYAVVVVALSGFIFDREDMKKCYRRVISVYSKT